MPDIQPFRFPEGAAAAVAEKAKSIADPYANLTAEERVEEGLPPATPAATPAAPVVAPVIAPDAPVVAPVAEPAAAVVAAPEPSNEEVRAATERLFEEIADLREDLSERIGALGPPASAKPKEDPLLTAALEHEDPVIRGLAERLREAEARSAEGDAALNELRVDRQLERDDAEFAALKMTYQIDGKPLTDAHVEQVEDWILANPEVARRLPRIEQAARLALPDAVRVGSRPSPAPPAKPAAATGEKPPVATIVDQGSGGGAPAPQFKPRQHETIGSAVQEAGRRFGWTR